MWYCPDKYNIDIPNVNQDLSKLFDLFNSNFAVQVVKHEYKTKYPIVGSSLQVFAHSSEFINWLRTEANK